jgi:NADH-quinone oxidoreductase subunit L
LPFAPTDSPWQLTAPLVILGVLAVIGGYLNAPAVNTHWFEHWTESSIGLPFGEGIEAVPEPPEFLWANALPSIALAVIGIAVSWFVSQAVFGGARNPFRPLVGLTRRNRLARAGHTFLVQKYYLDHLYEKVIVHGIAHPIAQAMYWINQNVIDAIVNGFGRAGRKIGTWIYRNVDQRVVDGAVNASGYVASESGHALQPVQSGKVNQYGALLFGGAMVGAIVLILVNV